MTDKPQQVGQRVTLVVTVDADSAEEAQDRALAMLHERGYHDARVVRVEEGDDE